MFLTKSSKFGRELDFLRTTFVDSCSWSSAIKNDEQATGSNWGQLYKYPPGFSYSCAPLSNRLMQI